MPSARTHSLLKELTVDFVKYIFSRLYSGKIYIYSTMLEIRLDAIGMVTVPHSSSGLSVIHLLCMNVGYQLLLLFLM